MNQLSNFSSFRLAGMDPKVAFVVSEVSLGQAISTCTSTRYSRDEPAPERVPPWWGQGQKEGVRSWLKLTPCNVVTLRERQILALLVVSIYAYYVGALILLVHDADYIPRLLHTVSDRNIYWYGILYILSVFFLGFQINRVILERSGKITWTSILITESKSECDVRHTYL